MDPDGHLLSLSLEFVYILVCLAFSAAFSMSETAVTSFSEIRAKHLLESKGKRARIMEFWLRNPTQVLTTILIGNNLFNVMASAIATSMVLRLFPAGGILLATIVMTVLIVVFSEIIPKIVARIQSDRLVVPALFFVRIVFFLLYPVTAGFAKMADKTIKSFGSLSEFRRPTITEEELSFLLTIGEKEGALEKEKKRLLDNVFKFGNTIVREVMTPRTDMVTIQATSPAINAIQTMLDKGHSRLPVIEDRIDNVVGIVHTKDILRRFRELGSMNFVVREVIREPIFVSETKPVDELLMDMKTKKRQMAVVVDEYGGTAGLITFEDLIEEIVGEVRDEYDEQEEDFIQKVSPNRFLVDTKLHYEDFLREFKDHLQEKEGEQKVSDTASNGDFDTLGGLLISHFGHIPKSGEVLNFGNLRIEVKEVGRRRVKKVEVQVPEAAALLVE